MKPPPSVTLDLQLAHSSDVSIPGEADFAAWVDKVLQHQQTDAAELTIRTVDSDESQMLNRDYRGKDKPTNVLSFPFDSDIPLPVQLLGDLVICVPVMQQEAVAQDKPVAHHWAHLVVHGTLHLLGYDHIEDEEAEHMESIEIEILKSLGISDPYRKEQSESHE